MRPRRPRLRGFECNDLRVSIHSSSAFLVVSVILARSIRLLGGGAFLDNESGDLGLCIHYSRPDYHIELIIRKVTLLQRTFSSESFETIAVFHHFHYWRSYTCQRETIHACMVTHIMYYWLARCAGLHFTLISAPHCFPSIDM